MTRTQNQIGQRGSHHGMFHARFVRSSVFQLLALSLVVFEFEARAQVGLVNLYDWSNQTEYVSPGSMGQFVSIYSNNSAGFFGGFTTNPGLPNAASPILSEQLITTPGVTYEISFTLQNLNSFDGSAVESFGNNSMSYDLPFTFLNGGESYTDTPVNVDFTAIATSPVTTVSFQFYLDPEGGAAALSNLTITDAPEMSTAHLVCYGGCALLLANQLRRLNKKRMLAIKPIA